VSTGNDPKQQMENTMDKDLNKTAFTIEELEIEPVSDDLLMSILGGLGEEDGIGQNSCSTNNCSN